MRGGWFGDFFYEQDSLSFILCPISMFLWYCNGKFLQIGSIFLRFFLEETDSYK